MKNVKVQILSFPEDRFSEKAWLEYNILFTNIKIPFISKKCDQWIYHGNFILFNLHVKESY